MSPKWSLYQHSVPKFHRLPNFRNLSILFFPSMTIPSLSHPFFFCWLRFSHCFSHPLFSAFFVFPSKLASVIFWFFCFSVDFPIYIFLVFLIFRRFSHPQFSGFFRFPSKVPSTIFCFFWFSVEIGICCFQRFSQKKKEETKTKKRLPFQLAFCWKQKKKATTSLTANVCSFLVLTKIKKRCLCLLTWNKKKSNKPSLFLFVRFWFQTEWKKNVFPSSSLETNKQQQAFSSWVCSSFDFAQNEQKYKNLDKRRILFTLGQVLGKLAKGSNSFEGVAQACFGFFANIFFLSKTFQISKQRQTFFVFSFWSKLKNNKHQPGEKLLPFFSFLFPAKGQLKRQTFFFCFLFFLLLPCFYVCFFFCKFAKLKTIYQITHPLTKKKCIENVSFFEFLMNFNIKKKLHLNQQFQTAWWEKNQEKLL